MSGDGAVGTAEASPDPVRIARLRALALAMPGAEESVRFGHLVWKARAGGSGFVWIRPFTKADVRREGPPPPGTITAFRVADELAKQELRAADDAVFTIQHFDGFPAVLAVLETLDDARLAELVVEAWIATAPPPDVRSWLDAHPDLDRDAGST
ncbi:MmcQ/YjbR family DNA-binding protein [Schumannella soli]|uniref:MmcQ/YjbR family DNA-binding protein n=1 Tax=Schumannella soli TaxID=2590779 RepID=A0A506XXY4_9MICO|nr:MmcQ/YjbR family DNA-binding protein [Schumannella soli]TPW74473.1 hypothetical protein FJ657_12770 [Schumannella soli]